jgi:hypothetical protein
VTAIQYISQLGAVASVGTTDILPVTQGSTGPLTGTTRKATVAQLFTSPTFTGTTTLGGNAANYVTVAGGTSGNPVTFTSVGDDASPDIRFVLPNRGAVSVPRLSIGNFTAGTSSTPPRLMSLFADQTMSGAGGPAVRIGGIKRGSLTSNLEGIYAQVLDEDRVAMSNTNNGILVNFMASTMRAGWSGGRTLHQTQLYVGNPASPGVGSSGTAGTSAYHVSGASFAYSYDSAGGVIGAHRGNLFGRNDATRVRTGSGQYWNSTFGNETDVGVTAGNMVLWKGGMKVVKWSDDAVPGLIADFAYGINDQAGASSWRVGWQIGGPEGAYPFGTNSQIMSYFPGLSGTPVAATGINFLGITFGRSTFESAGFRVGPTGNVGSLVASGGALQTRSAIVAKTAVVDTITVLEGGLYSGAVTLTCSASPGGGTLATATVDTYACEFFSQVAVGGSGYVVGNTITLTGGTFSTACVGTVNKVDGSGAVQGVAITTAGSYSVPPVGASATTTSGAGTGCTLVPFLKILTVTVTNAGTLYDEFLPPTITSSGAVSTTRQALLQVTMTATQAPLLLNTGSSTQVDSLTVNAAGPTVRSGTGAASGTQPRGSQWLRTDGGVGSTLYVSQGGGTWNAVAGV